MQGGGGEGAILIGVSYRREVPHSMLLNRLSLRDMEYAVAVADERHFGRAAERCHVSQPALSAQVKKLEATLGVQLFERTSRGVIVTGIGRRLIAQARRMLDEGRHLLEIASASGPLSGELVVDAIATLGPYVVPHILRPLREEFPAASFVLREGRTADILAALDSGQSDLALISTPILEEGRAVIPLFDEPFVAIHPADTALGNRTPITIEDLEGAEILLLEEGHCLRDQALALCTRAGVRTQRHATSLETLRHMVAAGAGCSLMPALAAESRESFGGLLRYTPIDDARACRSIALAFRASDPRAEHFARIGETIRDSMPASVRRAGGNKQTRHAKRSGRRG
jgi:LysR family hydrogen peroxide-inducible transcriptional activator